MNGGRPEPAAATRTLLKQPSAYAPIAMSVAAMLLVAGGAVYVSFGGVTYEQETGDEGILAHTFQLLMTMQLPIVAFFAAKWLPRAAKQALTVLAIQVAAWLAAAVPLYIFEHSGWPAP